MLATRAAEIAVERYGIPSSTMKAQTEPIAQAKNASGRQLALDLRIRPDQVLVHEDDRADRGYEDAKQ